jgi:hypothetical protein
MSHRTLWAQDNSRVKFWPWGLAAAAAGLALVLFSTAGCARAIAPADKAGSGPVHWWLPPRSLQRGDGVRGQLGE